MTRTQWYIGAPNGVILCIHGSGGGEMRGELYHSYSLAPRPFVNIEQMTQFMEELFDELRFPHPGNSGRSFVPAEPTYEKPLERARIMSDENLLSKHGDIATFIVRVQHRQNSSWQGRITWMEQDKTINFRSVWEMIQLMESAIDTVSEQEEDGEETPSWFDGP